MFFIQILVGFYYVYFQELCINEGDEHLGCHREMPGQSPTVGGKNKSGCSVVFISDHDLFQVAL